MKPFILTLALSFFVNVSTSHAELDCNTPQLDKINEHYICTTPKLKELNNKLNHLIEENIDDKIVMDRIMSTPQIRKNSLPNESVKMLNNEVYEYKQQINSWLNRQFDELYECRNEKCIETMYFKMTEQLKKNNHNYRCFLSEIAQNQEITRQAVRDIIKKGENKLFELEEKLGIMKKTFKQEEKIAIILSELTKNAKNRTKTK